MRVKQWLVLVYRIPTEPASKRVAIWRELKRTRALYLQQCVCSLPDIGSNAVCFVVPHQNYIFEEVEEIEQDLDKIRRWNDRIKERDWFAANRRHEVERWIERCQELSAPTCMLHLGEVRLTHATPPAHIAHSAASRVA